MVNRLLARSNSRTIKLVGAVLLGVFIAGCSSPSVRYYAISPTVVSALDTDRQLALAIGPNEFPRQLSRNQIVTRIGGNQIKVDQFNIWSSSLQLAFDRTLADNIATLLKSERVVAYPAQPRFAIDYRVIIDVQQFDGRRGDSVTLRGSWTAVDGAGDMVTIQNFSISQPTDGGSYDALVGAHSAAIGTLSTQIANGLIARPAPKD